MEKEIGAGLGFVGAVDAHDVVFLILHPDAPQEVRLFFALFGRRNVIHQRAHFAEELLTQELQLVMVIVEIAVEENQLHEPHREVVHAIKVVEALEHPPRQGTLFLFKILLVDAFLIQDQSSQKIGVTGGNLTVELFIILQILDVRLDHGRVLTHVFHQLRLGIKNRSVNVGRVVPVLRLRRRIGRFGFLLIGGRSSSAEQKDRK